MDGCLCDSGLGRLIFYNKSSKSDEPELVQTLLHERNAALGQVNYNALSQYLMR
jgi:hypothetical protein